MRGRTGWWAIGTAALLVLMGTNGAQAAAAAPEAPKAEEAWLGVYTQTLTAELKEGLNYNGNGALVSRVVEGSPAEKAGVKKGDVIVGFGSATVASSDDLSRAAGKTKVGQVVSVAIVRDGARRSLSAKLAARPAEDLEWSESPTAPRSKGDGDFEFMLDDLAPGLAMFSGGRGRLGVRVEDLNPDLGAYFGVPTGKGALVVEVLKDTPAERAGLKAGDVITKAGDSKVEDSGDLVRALREADKKVSLTVMRKNASRTIESELREAQHVFRYRHDGPMSWDDGPVRVRRMTRGDEDEVRRELEDLRRELRDLKTRMEGKSTN
jgi:serine protease Do